MARPGTYVRTPEMREAARQKSLRLWQDKEYRFNQRWGVLAARRYRMKQERRVGLTRIGAGRWELR